MLFMFMLLLLVVSVSVSAVDGVEYWALGVGCWVFMLALHTMFVGVKADLSSQNESRVFVVPRFDVRERTIQSISSKRYTPPSVFGSARSAEKLEKNVGQFLIAGPFTG